ncbi:MAG: hypothetical protein V3T05_00735 [Myxococcota bacterium]
MLSRTLLALAVAALIGGCRGDEPASSQASQATRLYTHQGLGVSFELPRAWEERLEGDALVFSGKTGNPDHFTTVTVQIVPRRDTGLLEALDAAVAPVVNYPGFAWQHREPVIIAGRPAVRYGFRVELHESQRMKHGLLVDTGRHFIDLAYAAPREIFASGIPVFEHLITTLQVTN